MVNDKIQRYVEWVTGKYVLKWKEELLKPFQEQSIKLKCLWNLC